MSRRFAWELTLQPELRVEGSEGVAGSILVYCMEIIQLSSRSLPGQYWVTPIDTHL